MRSPAIHADHLCGNEATLLHHMNHKGRHPDPLEIKPPRHAISEEAVNIMEMTQSGTFKRPSSVFVDVLGIIELSTASIPPKTTSKTFVFPKSRKWNSNLHQQQKLLPIHPPPENPWTSVHRTKNNNLKSILTSPKLASGSRTSVHRGRHLRTQQRQKDGNRGSTPCALAPDAAGTNHLTQASCRHQAPHEAQKMNEYLPSTLALTPVPSYQNNDPGDVASPLTSPGLHRSMWPSA